MGAVWRVWDRRDERYVAAKVLRQVDATSLLRFVREQSFRIDHPHVVMPLGWAGEDDRVLFTMPLVRGGSLATLVGDHGPLPVAWAAALLDQLLDALSAIHSSGIIHRDVKPANLLFEPTGTGAPHLQLSDFGIAAPVGQPRLTHTDVVVGTPGYLAPEVLRGEDPDPRQDLYAAGMTAIEMLLGSRPRSGVVPDDALATRDGAGGLVEVVRELVRESPVDRPSSAPQARQLLESTGLVPARGVTPDDDGVGVEIFDQVPPLPSGWDGDGPRADAPPPPMETAPADGAPARLNAAATAQSAASGTTPDTTAGPAPTPKAAPPPPPQPASHSAATRSYTRSESTTEADTTSDRGTSGPPPPPSTHPSHESVRSAQRRRGLVISFGVTAAGLVLLVFAITQLL